MSCRDAVLLVLLKCWQRCFGVDLDVGLWVCKLLCWCWCGEAAIYCYVAVLMLILMCGTVLMCWGVLTCRIGFCSNVGAVLLTSVFPRGMIIACEKYPMVFFRIFFVEWTQCWCSLETFNDRPVGSVRLCVSAMRDVVTSFGGGIKVTLNVNERAFDLSPHAKNSTQRIRSTDFPPQTSIFWQSFIFRTELGFVTRRVNT